MSDTTNGRWHVPAAVLPVESTLPNGQTIDEYRRARKAPAKRRWRIWPIRQR